MPAHLRAPIIGDRVQQMSAQQLPAMQGLVPPPGALNMQGLGAPAGMGFPQPPAQNYGGYGGVPTPGMGPPWGPQGGPPPQGLNAPPGAVIGFEPPSAQQPVPPGMGLPGTGFSQQPSLQPQPPDPAPPPQYAQAAAEAFRGGGPAPPPQYEGSMQYPGMAPPQPGMAPPQATTQPQAPAPPGDPAMSGDPWAQNRLSRIAQDQPVLDLPPEQQARFDVRYGPAPPPDPSRAPNRRGPVQSKPGKPTAEQRQKRRRNRRAKKAAAAASTSRPSPQPIPENSAKESTRPAYDELAQAPPGFRRPSARGRRPPR